MSQIASQDTKTAKDMAPMPSTSGAKPSSVLKELYAPVLESLKQVESILQTNLRSDTPWVDELLEHSWLLSGKRMRPVLLLLSGLAVQQRHDVNIADDRLVATLHPMAAAIEMIHTATLVHDDVIDDAEIRRHTPTANSKWDNRISVLLGDYLFTHAFHVGSQSNSVKALAMLAAASNKVCAGEMKQNFYAGRFDITSELYFEIISEKTAELCAVSCAAGALLSGADTTAAGQSLIDQFEQYGRDLGMAFQIIDDILDLVGDPNTVGKTLGTDLINRKPTLPVIHCLSQLNDDQKTDLLQKISEPAKLPDVIEILNSTNSIEHARRIARSHIENAVAFASSLGEGSAAQAMLKIAQFVLERSN